MAEEWRPTDALVRQVYQLACTPFTYEAWRTKWIEFGWTHDPSPQDKYGFGVSLPDHELLITPTDDGGLMAVLPFYHWEDYTLEFHPDPQMHAREKKAYDDAFDATARLALRQLPEPFLMWTDGDADAHRALAWEGTEGILVLQQACRDPQFGIEVDFWLARGRKTDFVPRTPLIDWLMQRE